MRSPREPTRYAALPVLFLFLFFILPVGVLFLYAAGAASLAQAPRLLARPAALLFSLGASVMELFETPFFRNRILFTLGQAALSTLFTMILGLPLAYLFGHHRIPGQRFLRAAFTAPFVLPALVVALALQAAFGPRNPLGFDFLNALGPLGAILLAHVVYNTSLILRLVGTFWQRLPPEPAEAARTLGASRLQTFLSVELPLIRPALVAAALLVFVFDLTSFGVILLLGGDRVGTIETALYGELRSFRPQYATAAALALLQLVITYAALSAFVALQRRLRTPLAPRPVPARPPMPAWGWLALGPALLLILAPLVALVAGSLQYAGHASLEPWRLLWEPTYPLGPYHITDAVRNSLTFAAGTLLLSLPLAFLAALASQRARRPAWTDALLMLPLGLSSVVVGLGLFLTWNGSVLPDLRASPLRIVLAHTLVAFPFAARILTPTLEALAPALREAARTLGARPGTVVRRIDLPLAAGALGVAAVYAFGASLGEFGAALVLRRAETVTLPLALFDATGRIGAPFEAQAQALAALLMLVALGSFVLLERFRVPGREGLL